MHVVIAPDSFKGSASAASVSAALAEGWRAVRPHDTVTLAPMADGGEGTLEAVAAATGARATRMPVTVTGPHDRPVEAEWLLIEEPDGTRAGLVELALCSGLELLNELPTRHRAHARLRRGDSGCARPRRRPRTAGPWW